MLGCIRKATAPTAIDKEKGKKKDSNSIRIIRDNDTDGQVIKTDQSERKSTMTMIQS